MDTNFTRGARSVAVAQIAGDRTLILLETNELYVVEARGVTIRPPIRIAVLVRQSPIRIRPGMWGSSRLTVLEARLQPLHLQIHVGAHDALPTAEKSEGARRLTPNNVRRDSSTSFRSLVYRPFVTPSNTAATQSAPSLPGRRVRICPSVRR